jgi:hypothetical protein
VYRVAVLADPHSRKTSAATTNFREIGPLIVYKEREAHNAYKKRETLATG